MELEDLKAIWQQYASQEIEKTSLDEQEIKKLLKGKTQTAVSSINRSIVREGGILLLVTLGLAAASFIYGDLLTSLFFIPILGICLVYTIYYIFKYQQINKISITEDNLKIALYNLINTIEVYLRIYLYGNLILSPITFLSGFLYGVLIFRDKTLVSPMDWKTILVGVIIFGIITLFLYPILRWLIKKSYGQYLENLKVYAQELSMEDV